ncbi:MAG: zinc ribbon domain-containing protein [Candidatus Lokiarchaeota archaeon]|nr:zinc ribbon domain-containing protein [Candidatus Lokiarchaeota archaeon]
MMNVNVIYEENVPLNIEKTYEITLQWLNGTHKAKIKKSNPPKFIEAKQGTVMANTGHDPNWKKRIRINLYELEGSKTLIRVEASPLSRNVLRVEKLKKSWYDGLFSHLFTLLYEVGSQPKQNEILTRVCPYCGSKIEDDIETCTSCGTKI